VTVRRFWFRYQGAGAPLPGRLAGNNQQQGQCEKDEYGDPTEYPVLH